MEEQQKTDQQLTQEQIKKAVSYSNASQGPPQAPEQSLPLPPPQPPQNVAGLQPSILGPQQEYTQEPQAPAPSYSQAVDPYQETTQPYQQSQGNDYGYSYDQSSAPPISSDTITEIADQIVSEKLSNIRRQIEKAIDVKTTADAKLSHIDERLLRIEKIIDRLQLSILQKVGEQMTSVSSLKKELFETQKSFKTLSKPHHATTHKAIKKHSRKKK